MSLPLKLDWSLAQNRWKSQLDPVIANPLNGIAILQGIVLISGVNNINHLLGRMQQGWFVTDINAAATIFRSQPFNAVTLTLTSNAAATVNIGVF